MTADKRRPEGSNLFLDVFAWFSNVVTSILIIFLTKWLLTTYQFKVGGAHAARVPGARSTPPAD